MKCSGRYTDADVNMGAAVTAADGDSANLDICELPLLTLLRDRLTNSYILDASVETHLTYKFTQLSSFGSRLLAFIDPKSTLSCNPAASASALMRTMNLVF